MNSARSGTAKTAGFDWQTLPSSPAAATGPPVGLSQSSLAFARGPMAAVENYGRNSSRFHARLGIASCNCRSLAMCRTPSSFSTT
jgi:hypothetical protein